jgi:hypothetical protein
MVRASNFSLDKVPLLRSSGDVPGPRQPPFSVGIALSARLCISFAFQLAAFASWSFPFPLRSSAFLAVGLTFGIDRPVDLIGVTSFRMCETQLGRMPSLLWGMGVRSRDLYVHGDQCSLHHRMSRSDDQI